MLKITPHHSLAAALWYFRNELVSGYYGEDGVSPGTWHGQLAERLGLSGEIGEKEWSNLCHNLLPDGSGPLTPNSKEGRRVCVDWTWNAPKSASLEAAIGHDAETVRTAFREAVLETMGDVERDMDVRVRAKGEQANRTSGNLLFGMFVHDVTRPQDRVPDPHLHAHCVVQNCSFDPVENRIKAAAFTMIRDGRYYEALFHSRFTEKLVAAGFDTERRGDYWEIAGYPRRTVEAFSRRREKILKDAADRGITDPERRTKMVLRTRERKDESLSRPEMEAEWRRIARGLAIPTGKVRGTGEKLTAEQCVARALTKQLERDSVVPERAVLESALRFGFGSVKSEAIHATLASREDVLRATLKDGRKVVTMTAVLAEEQDILRYAREGRGQCVPLDHIYKCRDPGLTPDQRAAIGHVLASRDRVTLAVERGGTAGEATLRTTIQAIESTGQKVVMLTPSSQGKESLHQRGFGTAEELRELFANKELAARARGQVIWLDSAHQTGRGSLKRVMEATKDLEARIVISYDADARDSSRGNVIGLLRKEAGLGNAPAIQAGPDHAGTQTHLVKVLDELGKQERIREVKWEGQRDAALCEAHTAAIKAGKSVAVFAPNAVQAERITPLLRAGLRDAGRIRGEDVPVERLVRSGWTETDRRDPKRYQEGQVVQFMRPGGGFAAGMRGVVSGIDAGGEVRVRTERGERALPLSMAARFQVYGKDTISLAAGDRIRLTQGARMPDGRLVNSGQTFTVAGFSPNGDIETTSGRDLPKSVGHLAHDWVLSPPPPIVRADLTLISQPAKSQGLESLRQILSATAGSRERPVVFTDDAKALRAAAVAVRERMTATDLAHVAAISIPHRLLQLRRQQEEHAVTFGRIVGASPHVRRLVAERTMTHHVRERSRGRA